MGTKGRVTPLVNQPLWCHSAGVEKNPKVTCFSFKGNDRLPLNCFDLQLKSCTAYAAYAACAVLKETIFSFLSYAEPFEALQITIPKYNISSFFVRESKDEDVSWCSMQ